MPNPYYDAIMQIHDSYDIRAVAERWHTLSENIKKVTGAQPILLPDLLLVSESGGGKTKLLRLISEYLYHQENLMEFYGNLKFFEFSVGYCPPDSNFPELTRFMDAVRHAAGFRNEYKGLICLDLDEWVGHEEEKHFFTLLEYLSSNSDIWMIIFAVSPPKERSQALERILSMYFRLERVTIELPETRELMHFITKRLDAYQISMDKDAEETIFRTVELLRRNPYFDGYKTLKLLCQDMIYHVFSSGKQAKPVVSKEVAALFSEDSAYIKRTLQQIKRKNAIGF